MTGAICFLVINNIEELPHVAIKSALNNSGLPVIVGYVAENDINPLRDLPVKFVKIMEVETPVKSGDYSAFDESDFYRIVMNKWQLLLQILPEFDFLIYSDIDVLWIEDASAEIGSVFQNKAEVDLVMQSFGPSESSPSLCMGFIGVRNTERSFDFIRICKSKHKELISTNPLIGDDDVATAVLRDLNYPLWLHRLSPIYFPVGNTLDLFTGKQSYPGIGAPKPFIFHLNYVVGLKNKRLMMRVISLHNPTWNIETTMTITWRISLILKKFKFLLGQFRKSFN
jgi:hypothetical protein